MTDREFVSTTGTQHRQADNVCRIRIHGKFQFTAACNQAITSDGRVVQQLVRKCKRCYPKDDGS